MADADLEGLREVIAADVYKRELKAASLVRRHDGILFQYTTEYLHLQGPPVATTLPLTDEPVRTSAGAVPAFFAGLLPEGRRLTSLRRAVKTSADDELTLLLAVGTDTVGDVRVIPEGKPRHQAEPLLQVNRDWSEVKFSEVLAEANIDRVGIPGAQDKVSAGMISVPLRQAGRRYILKVAPPDYPHVVENEAFFLQLASRVRMRSAEAKVVTDADGTLGLLVTRFDRRPDASGRTVSLACEDACQVLGRWPADKYNVSCEEAINALADRCPARSVAARSLFEQVCFAWLTGNGDLHAKNLAILATDEGEWQVAPSYDLPSTVPYGDATFALPVQGAKTGLSRRRLLDFGKAVGLNEKVCTKVLDQLLKRTEGLDGSVTSLPFAEDTIVKWQAELRFRRRLAGP